jgi:hypothetical protein
VSVNQVEIKELDMEWVHLIMAARSIGLSKDEVRAFLRDGSHSAQYVTDPANNEQVCAFKETVGNTGYK